MTDRDLTIGERRWFKRLQRCFRDMPETAEVTVHSNGCVSIHERGATEEAFQRDGDLGLVSELGFFQTRNLYADESSV